VLLQVDAGAQVQVVQEHVGLATKPCLVNAVTEAHVGEAATLRLTKLKHDSPSTTHVALTAVHQERDSNYEGYSFSWNAGHVRNDDQVVLDGEGAHCALHGLIHLQGEQVADDHTQVHHRKPHTTSNEHYRAVLDDRSRGAFSGAIFVEQDAQQISSQQSSRNLLLSDQALMNTKPELQILADDVKCSHGATIGQLDPEALFYLRTRGVGREEAMRILTLAFGRAVVDHVPLECVRQALTAELFGEEDGDGH
jgi:Fe-S cluster assembly protein SufD